MKTVLTAIVLALCLSSARGDNPQPQQLFAFPCTSGFASCPDGADIQALLQASDGNFYGVANLTTNFSGGTVFRITPTGIFTVLHTFVAGAGGIYPGGNMPNSLIEGPDGNLYGTTLQGGHDNLGDSGVLFRIAKSGSGFKVVHKFCAQPGCPDGNSPNFLTLASDGNLYGLSARGVFQYSPTKKLFTGLFSGLPFFFGAQFAQASDGSFYGTALLNDTTGESAIWKATSTGVQSLLAIFPANVFPASGLLANDGGLLGMYENAHGTIGIYSVSVGTGTFQFLPAFPGVTLSGATPVLAGDGNLWTPDTTGGGFGRILEISPTTGQIVNSFLFSGGDGQNPTTLIQAKNGIFVGVTHSGGVVPAGKIPAGVIFTLNASGVATENDSELQP